MPTESDRADRVGMPQSHEMRRFVGRDFRGERHEVRARIRRVKLSSEQSVHLNSSESIQNTISRIDARRFTAQVARRRRPIHFDRDKFTACKHLFRKVICLQYGSNVKPRITGGEAFRTSIKRVNRIHYLSPFVGRVNVFVEIGVRIEIDVDPLRASRCGRGLFGRRTEVRCARESVVARIADDSITSRRTDHVFDSPRIRQFELERTLRLPLDIRQIQINHRRPEVGEVERIA